VLEKKYSFDKVQDGSERGTWVEITEFIRTVRGIVDEFKLKTVYMDGYYVDRRGLHDDEQLDIDLGIKFKDVSDPAEEEHLSSELAICLTEHYGVPVHIFPAEQFINMPEHIDRDMQIYWGPLPPTKGFFGLGEE
jgi:hypothetical protein